MRELYAKVRQERKKDKLRLVVLMSTDEVNALDRWATAQAFTSRAAALREIIRASTAEDAAKAA